MTHGAPRVVFVGVGAIGGTAGAWIAARHPHVWFHGRATTNSALRAHGITTYRLTPAQERASVRVQVLEDLRALPDADIVVLGVKNYSLEDAARAVREAMGSRPIVVGLQNGAVNQTILPRYFERVVYGVVAYNAWQDSPGVFGYQRRGPILFGGAADGNRADRDAVAALFQTGLETQTTDRLRDAVHTKLVINLALPLTALVGMPQRAADDPTLAQRLLARVAYEGVQTVRAAGCREHKIPGIPGWRLIAAGARLPAWLTRGAFRRNTAKMTISSMAQDVLVRRAPDTELESINGYLVDLAEQHGVPAPYNRAVLALCRREFARPDFQPWRVSDVWRAIADQV